jgi:hypothetical protein
VTIRQYEILITLNIGFGCIRGMEQGSLLGVKERVVSEKVVGEWRTGSSVRRRADRNLKRKCGPPPPPLQGERRERMGWGEGGRERACVKEGGPAGGQETLEVAADGAEAGVHLRLRHDGLRERGTESACENQSVVHLRLHHNGLEKVQSEER